MRRRPQCPGYDLVTKAESRTFLEDTKGLVGVLDRYFKVLWHACSAMDVENRHNYQLTVHCSLYTERFALSRDLPALFQRSTLSLSGGRSKSTVPKARFSRFYPRLLFLGSPRGEARIWLVGPRASL